MDNPGTFTFMSFSLWMIALSVLAAAGWFACKVWKNWNDQHPMAVVFYSVQEVTLPCSEGWRNVENCKQCKKPLERRRLAREGHGMVVYCCPTGCGVYISAKTYAGPD